MKIVFSFALLLSSYFLLSFYKKPLEEVSWIRINLLGYTPTSVKVAVWCTKGRADAGNFQLVDAITRKVVFSAPAGRDFGTYGPFLHTRRLNFSSFKKPGHYQLVLNGTYSPAFTIGEDVYRGSADFCLRYMRQQRTGFNPFLKDSCHTHDGYTLYGPMKDSSHIDVVGGWHDASDYLQYSTTSANATYHLLMAWRDFPSVFGDTKLANGLEGSNGQADVLDEARWGLDWLLKMHPQEDWMFNQIGDDRDHISMRIPKQDSQYGKGYERPVYFINGEPQQRGKFMNNTTGTSSTAAKFSSAFGLGARLFTGDAAYQSLLRNRERSAFRFAEKKPGVTQTVSVLSPYIYAEDNWVDDMELAAANMNSSGYSDRAYTELALRYAKQERITPWLGNDTARHYQWYPFINLGHYELARQLKGSKKDSVTGYYKQGIDRVWKKASQNAFFRAIPYIWCSNNLTVSFAIQCFWYRKLSGDNRYTELEQANFDWIFGCNPWGTSMVYGLPANGDYPTDPHSAFTHLKNYPIDGGLVDGPVYGSIYKNLIGIKLYHDDEYAPFQSSLAVYHDDYGDYSTNEPTMDGTASLVYLMASREAIVAHTPHKSGYSISHGATIRGDSTKKQLALVFTGDEFADGGDALLRLLHKEKIKASFFLTGRFYRNPAYQNILRKARAEGHYMGPHSNDHLLYCDWTNRDSLLVNRKEFIADLQKNYEAMGRLGLSATNARFFLPPFEWYNDSIAAWTSSMGLSLVNYTPGTLSHADYTLPDEKNYRDNETIFRSITTYEQQHKSGLNGFLLLMHIGTDPKRIEKFYDRLPALISWLKGKGYRFERVDELLAHP